MSQQLTMPFPGSRGAPRPGCFTVSQAQYSSDWNSSLHTHGCAELFFILDGHGQFRTQNEQFPISVQDLLIVNTNVPHTELSQMKTPLKYIVLGGGRAGGHDRRGRLCHAPPPHRLGGADGLPPPDAPGGGGRPAGL